MHSELQPNESQLTGKWLESNGIVTGDQITERIIWLINERLQRIARDGANWTALFRDPADGRLWELSYPNSEWHGGGPPKLAIILPDDAAEKYPSTT